jgi:hypothetical protein
MLLAMLFSEAALSAAEESERPIVNGSQERIGGAPAALAAPVRGHFWTPRVGSWTDEKGECPIFFQREIEGFGLVRVGPRCAAADGFPHAL